MVNTKSNDLTKMNKNILQEEKNTIKLKRLCNRSEILFKVAHQFKIVLISKNFKILVLISFKQLNICKKFTEINFTKF